VTVLEVEVPEPDPAEDQGIDEQQQMTPDGNIRDDRLR